VSPEEFLENVKLTEELKLQIMESLKSIKSEYADYFKQNPPKLKERIVEDLSLHYMVSLHGESSNFADVSIRKISFDKDSNLPDFIKERIVLLDKSVHCH
jgi:hypothetical protein